MTGNPLLLLNYELKLTKHLDIPENLDFAGKLQYMLDVSLMGTLRKISIHNGPHPCLDVTFSDETINMEMEIMHQMFNHSGEYNLSENDRQLMCEEFDQRIMDPILAELRAYERQEFTYREIEI